VSKDQLPDLPIGVAVVDWKAPPIPLAAPLQGGYARVEPLDVATHSDSLFAAFAQDRVEQGWTYMGYGPFVDKTQFDEWLVGNCLGADPMFFSILEQRSGAALGMASFMNINPAGGSIEVGNIHFSPSLRRTRVATDAMYVMMRYAFEMGYRRYEWKCNAFNAASRAAALRFGFSYEGVFRQHMVVKGRNRDTAWYACVDHEWPGLRVAYETWLAPENFHSDGNQRTTLASLTAPLLIAIG
jgi:RimJ/RimL family protein N-acetyltransferase